MDFLKHTLWPGIKVRLTFWWWVVKYGGKKNIPQELIFGKISGSMERMKESLIQAMRHMPKNLSEAEKKEFFDLLRTAEALENEVEKTKKN
ncbi:MAG: hypothetical protein A2W52_01775 [Candidatus Taylorbacteria bacterium RIFCSPHIGHO2_02_49_25]|uniref:Uncharacterized protein n=1 Tax=Candidatus Taylorbacteria bacterium RIFCSPHIGHO2_02_49_25 TaxID=1802305 RepID=A0A1G2MDN0_9BACT|nr:MAG: hypothetical protein UY62_C0010G0026 [Parcubacteria group bacterium GW2011_GWF2_50_9]OHA19178.1 MAG: hypothetical protein A2759_00615 [Candidatus Taylorbacteria bacterium RIFCSPHIGHO2_01_FULL_49_60]OHA21121.1 MAG: hypothetical protein A2W52_01775 [Candidatus Taylorbacteria bacterium RIFCSPHIGHO2_02_49_25]OHA36756.1 MAG: hypothetical protein A3B27_01675 [Candidatus Taylorbacteria bacterium RIFCSPLOWO2_01_FULL_50_130]OHA37292.1 MAG: hypothetical protein A2W65_03410 [Candidatus Taylorbacte